MIDDNGMRDLSPSEIDQVSRGPFSDKHDEPAFLCYLVLENFVKNWGWLAKHDRDAAHILGEIKIILKRREEWGDALVSSAR